MAHTWIAPKSLSPNADSSMSGNFELDSHVIGVTDVQSQYDDLHSAGIHAETSLAVTLLSENADSSTDCNIELDLNVIDERDMQSQRHNLHTHSRDSRI
jgi:hypothetical protein